MKKVSPIKIFIPYWIFTLFLYEFGPFAWVTYKPILFWGLNTLYILFFCLGWHASKHLKLGSRFEWKSENEKKLLERMNWLLYINLLYEVLLLFRAFSLTSLNTSLLVQKIIYGISNMGESYNSFQESVSSSSNVIGGRVVSLFNYVWAIWTYPSLLLGILYFKKLKVHQKLISAANVFLEVINYLARGTNIGVFRILLAFVVFFYISYMNKHTTRKHKRGRKIKLILIGAVAIILTVTLFNRIMQSRGGIKLWQWSGYNIGGIYLNRKSIFFEIIPPVFHQLWVSLSSYLTQGYYGMSLTLRVPWEPMWGIGNSMAIQNTLSNFIPDISRNTYQVRIEKFGWDSYIQWHSMYSWFANDVTYFGVVFIMLLFGYLFYKAMQDSIELNNPYAKLMLYYLFLQAVFLPCNNQITQTTYMLFSFVYVFIKWQLSKRNISIKKHM